jgi:lipoprotein NlpI
MLGWGARTIVAACAGLLWPGAASATPYSDFNAGLSANESGMCDKAVVFFSSALGAPGLLADLRPIALIDRGICYDGMKKYGLALADFSAAITLRPDSFDAYFARAGVFADEDRFDEAVADYQSAIRIRPDIAKGYMGLAYVHTREKSYDALVNDSTNLINLNIDRADAYLLRAHANVLKGDMDAALDDADEVVSIDDKLLAGHIERGRIYVHEQRFSRAEDAFDDALRIDSANFDALFDKAIVQLAQDECKPASETLQLLAAYAPANAYIALWLDIARFRAGKPDADLVVRAVGIDLKDWPGQIVSLYLGRSTPDAVLGAVGIGDEESRDDRDCEAHFYIAEWQLQRGAKDIAADMLAKIAEVCPRSAFEADIAAVELKRLKS